MRAWSIRRSRGMRRETALLRAPASISFMGRTLPRPVGRGQREIAVRQVEVLAKAVARAIAGVLLAAPGASRQPWIRAVATTDERDDHDLPCARRGGGRAQRAVLA